jgi:hypothetical protein
MALLGCSRQLLRGLDGGQLSAISAAAVAQRWGGFAPATSARGFADDAGGSVEDESEEAKTAREATEAAEKKRQHAAQVAEFQKARSNFRSKPQSLTTPLLIQRRHV